MQTVLVSYTLRKPGQDYDAIQTVLRQCAIRIAHVDDGLWYLHTDFTEAQLEAFLNAAKDENDTFVIWGPNVRPYNRTVRWEAGSQASLSDALRARPHLQALLAKLRRA